MNTHETTPATDGDAAALRKREYYRKTFVEHPFELISVFSAVRDARGLIVDWLYEEANTNALALLRKTHEELIGKHLSEVLSQQAARLIPLFTRVVDTQTAVHYESHFDARDFLVTLFAYDANTVISTANDITTRLNSARELQRESDANRAEKEWLTAVLDSMNEEVYFTDIHGRYTYANPTAMREFNHVDVSGVPVMEIVGALEVLHTDSTPRSLEDAPPLRALRGEVIRGEEQLVRIPRSGELRHREVSSAPVRNAKGEIIGSVSVVRDVTEHRRAEAAVLESAKRKDEFLAVLAHELRNPLAALSAAAQLLNKATQRPDVAAMARDALQRQVTHMGRLLDDLLDVARITHGRVQLQMHRVELAQVIQSSIETVRAQFDAKQHRLQVKLDGRAAHVRGDAIRLAQIVGNLLTNAAKYTPAGGHIELELRVEHTRALIFVRDNGIGVAKDMLPKIFEMFTQANRTPGMAGGLGIGLALVKGLVEMHGGSVEARSAGEQCGTEFVISLPLLPADPVPQTAIVPAATVTARPLRILIADDNADSAVSWGFLLEELGHTVRTVFDGQAAWDEAQLFKPEVALLDIGMPLLTGYELARNIRATPWGAHTTLVAITGWGQAKDRQDARDAGFDHHLTKPTSFADITVLLQRI